MKCITLSLALLCGAASAQCGGNGWNGRLTSDPQALNTTVRIIVEGGPNAAYMLFLSGNLLPTLYPGFGTVCLDLADPAFGPFIQGALAANGRFELPIAIPNDPALLAVLAFIQGLVADPAAPLGFALTNTLRVDFGTQDSFEASPALGQARALATLNAGWDGRLLIAGGGSGTLLSPAGTNSTELFDPVTRSIAPGPNMAVQRAFHTGTTLQDGRILLCGGVSSGGGNVTASCEIFDPATTSFSPAASMGTARAVHTATLLADGRVLVTGGTPTFTGATLGAILNGSLTSGEVYDPVANTWTPVSNAMASRRFGHTAILLSNGTAMVISGINGATNFFGVEIPSFTTSVSIYNPGTNSFSAGTAINTGRAFHGTVRLANGHIWVTGGILSGLIPAITNTTRRWSGSAWSTGPNLPTAIGLPSHATLRNLEIHTYGGTTGDLVAQTFGAAADCTRYDATTLATTAPLPTAQAGALVALLPDGSVFMGGGADSGGSATALTRIHVPAP